MRAINHAMTGALIGLMVGNPIVVLPVAIASHFVCDAIPHYDSDMENTRWLQTRLFKQLLVGDAVCCLILVLVLAITHPAHWLVACIAAFLAASPDFVSIDKFRQANKGVKNIKLNAYTKFATAIQWFEHPSGAVVEVTWFACASLILAGIIRMR